MLCAIGIFSSRLLSLIEEMLKKLPRSQTRLFFSANEEKFRLMYRQIFQFF